MYNVWWCFGENSTPGRFCGRCSDCAKRSSISRFRIRCFCFGGYSTNIATIIYPGLVFSIGGGALLLVDAVLIFRGMRAGYFLSIILWVLILAVDVWGISSPDIGFFGIISAPALAYCVACLAYFLTHNVRTYFGT